LSLGERKPVTNGTTDAANIAEIQMNRRGKPACAAIESAANAARATATDVRLVTMSQIVIRRLPFLIPR
jgi:hypothetical protein